MHFLDFSRKFLFDLKSIKWDKEDSILSKINKKRIHRDKYLKVLGLIGANLYYYNQINPACFITIGLSKSFYDFNADIFLNLFKILEKEKIIRIHKGFYFKNKSKLTRIEVTEKGLSYIGSHKKIGFVKKDLIVLKDDNKKVIKYKDTNKIKKMKTFLKRYNEHLSDIKLVINNKEMPEQRVYRVFNNNSFKQGGRFYGGGYQQIPKNERKSILINGSKVCEYDYHCLHLNILYHKKKLNNFKDAYLLPNYNRRYRVLVKKAIYTILNSKSFSVSLKSLRYETSRNKNYPECDLRDLIHLICVKHKKITKDFFNPKIGLNLQYQESMLAQKIIETFLDKNIPILSIHDSFITTKENENFLVKTMKKIYKDLYKNDIQVDKKY